ncbi:MAG: non-canonical purine NTP pyrophosphatase [Tissierellia bacterium]|nr:non-canonical purine NTP pyrophosphatase [Tissierellia bacterium]
MELFFNTINKTKQCEITELFAPFDCDVKFLDYNITEILSHDIEKVILAKSLAAFKKHQVPVIVEHGALVIDFFNGFPGALSKPMWDLMEGKICDLIPEGETRKAKVISAVCYCDGKKRFPFFAETEGIIAPKAQGCYGFQFDPIFIPKGSAITYAEMCQTEKLKYSQATRAYEQLQEYLKLSRK